jgi:O-antigen/teichoic acid export membrane protein
MYELLKKRLSSFRSFHATPLTLQTGQVFLTRCGGMLLGLCSTLALTRWLGISAYGNYAYIVSWVAILTIPSAGMEALVVRETAIARQKNARGALGGFLRWSIRNTLLVSGALTFAALLVFSACANLTALDLRTAYLLGLAGAPLLCLQIFAGAVFRGFRRVDLTVFLNEIVLPILTMLWIVLCLLFGIGASASIAFGGRLIVLALILFIYFMFIFRLNPAWQWAESSRKQKATWRKSMYSLALLRGIDTVMTRIPVLILGLLIGPISVALFSLSARIAETVVFTFSIISLTIGPHVAELHARQDYSGIQQLVTRSTRTITLWAIPVALALVVFGNWILGWFGPQFRAGYPVLLVLIAGKTFDAITGNVGLVMTMGGFERVVARTRAIGLFLTATLCFALVPKFGALGSSIGCATALIAWNSILVFQLYRRLGIVTIAWWPSRLLPRISGSNSD